MRHPCRARRSLEAQARSMRAPEGVEHRHQREQALLGEHRGLRADGAERAAGQARLEPGRDEPHGAEVAGQPVDLALGRARGAPAGACAGGRRLRAAARCAARGRRRRRRSSSSATTSSVWRTVRPRRITTAGEVVLVATWQLAHRHRRPRREQAEPHVGLHGRVQGLDEHQAPEHPALVAAEPSRDGRLRQVVVAVERPDQPRLLELGEPAPVVQRQRAGPWPPPRRRRRRGRGACASRARARRARA